nr:choice-of-anchor B family protein [Salsipaludibacter albus]
MAAYAAVNTGDDRAAPCVDGVAYVPEFDGHPYLGSGAFPCEAADLVSVLTNDEIGGGLAVGDGRGSDVWGWTDPETGREYVLAGLEVGTAFVDISEPRDPVYLAFLPTSATNDLIWRDIKTYQDHAFIVAESSNHGMQVFDLTKLRDLDPSAAPHTVTEDALYTGFQRAHNIAIDTDTGFAYAVGQRNDAHGCASTSHLIDIRDPLNPTFAGCYDENGYVHDTQCVIYEGPDGRYTGQEICFNSNPSTPGIGRALVISDMTDKSNLETLSRTGYPNPAYSHQGYLLDGHRYYLHNSETTNRVPQGVDIFDVADLENPVHIGFFENPAQSTQHNMYQRDRFVYQSNYSSGLRVYDPAEVGDGTLEEVAYLDVYPPHDDPGFGIGSWSNYTAFDSGVMAVHGYQGLFLVDPRLPTFAMLDDSVDDLVDAGGLANPFASQVRRALDLAEASTTTADQAQVHLERAIRQLRQQADVAERTPRPTSGDPAGMRALADELQEKVEDLDGAP